jgi:hypothetical protein
VTHPCNFFRCVFTGEIILLFIRVVDDAWRGERLFGFGFQEGLFGSVLVLVPHMVDGVPCGE